ncbi:hypothetical protein GALMADRAFT_141422 [Galerina marginata CBS 339.88]|uniref:CHAT domain-containing protein n=1 Tax=Galerina marginata (strain CBS 339.88) TaxID=685588 RepID=A0A067SWE8_GALM3|nr:hypothetical protein GALMADRAFT_141422 [Galerina marginata CBS 339.88]
MAEFSEMSTNLFPSQISTMDEKAVEKAGTAPDIARQQLDVSDSCIPQPVNQLAKAVALPTDVLDDQTAAADVALTEPPITFPETFDDAMTFYEFPSRLLTHYQEESGEMDHLNIAISLLRQGRGRLPMDNEIYPALLDNLGIALWTRYEQGGEENDIEEAISSHGQAMDIRLATHPDQSNSLSLIANAHLARFERRGQQSDLEKAVHLNGEALGLRPLPHVDRSDFLNNLANTLFARFEHKGKKEDLDEAVSLLRQALELFPSSHPSRTFCLNNLANALRTRSGNQIDLNEAVSLYREGLQLRPSPDPLRPSSLTNLAVALVSRFKVGNDPKDLNEATLLNREALQLYPTPHPLRSTSLNNLAITLLSKFELEHHRSDLDEATLCSREALALRAPPHPRRHLSLDTLVNVLTAKFNEDGQESDLKEIVLSANMCLALQPQNHPDRPRIFRNMGLVAMKAHSLFPENTQYLGLSISLFCLAAECASQVPAQRYLNAKTWAYHANVHHHPSALDAYETFFRVLPQFMALAADVQLRHGALSIGGTDGIAREAAGCAIAAGNLSKAVEFLEAGRAIFWSQSLLLHTLFDQVRVVAPELGSKLQSIANALERASHRDTFTETLNNQERMTLEKEAIRLERLDAEWTKTLQEVRRLKGFEDFLLPRHLSSLQAAAAQCPVVLLISNDDRSDCLIITSTIVDHIAIPSLPVAELRKLVYLIQAAASQSEISRTSIIQEVSDHTKQTATYPVSIQDTLRTFMEQAEQRGMRFEHEIPSDDVFESVLNVLWTDVVKPVIDFLNIKKSKEPPVVQWCPTGLFTLLPIHAAGCYNKKLSVECASDFIISTYTPTIGVLLPPPNSDDPTTPSASRRFEMMAVADVKRLSYARRELEKIKARVPKESLVQLGIRDAPALLKTVSSYLPTASIVHFACHGKQDKLKPLNSALLMEDGNLTIRKIMQHPSPHGSLAFLCACETAVGDEHLPDEAMSLGASLLFAGFRHVVATMWEIMDVDGPTIADAFYEELFLGPDGKPALEPDIAKSARALHIAVQKLRSMNVPFRHWVPFIHLGN